MKNGNNKFLKEFKLVHVSNLEQFNILKMLIMYSKVTDMMYAFTSSFPFFYSLSVFLSHFLSNVFEIDLDEILHYCD